MCLDIENNTRNAKAQTDTMVETSGKALEEVAFGAEAMDKLHNHAQDVARDNKETVEYVVALNERTKVVEDEIRGLSEQTKAATEDITAILAELNKDVEQVTASINHSVKTVEEQND